MEKYIKLLSHLPMIILGIVAIMMSNKLNFKKQRKKYEIEIDLYNSIVKIAIRQIGYIYIIMGSLSFLNRNISLIIPVFSVIPIVFMGGKIRGLEKDKKRIDKLV